MKPFEYVRPKTIAEAVAAASEPGAVYLAAGTNLLDLMKGGVSECRNESLQTMLRMIGAGDEAGSGIDKIRQGKHGARSPKQAIAIGLSEARRAGVDLPPPSRGKAKSSTRKSAKYAYEAGQHRRKVTRRPKVSRAVSNVLEHEPKSTASHKALSRQAKRASARRSATSRSEAARTSPRPAGD